MLEIIFCLFRFSFLFVERVLQFNIFKKHKNVVLNFYNKNKYKMKNLGFKKIHLFLSSFFVFILHLPNMGAKSKSDSHTLVSLESKQHMIADPSFDNVNSINCIAGLSLYDSLKLGSLGLGRQVFDYAMLGFKNMKQSGKLSNDGIISIIDFSKPSTKKRLFIIDLKKVKVIFNTYVAHGINSGKEFANEFSNLAKSNKSSLGFYTTANTYSGKHGYSLHLHGEEEGINDNAYNRDIVVHAAEYVNEQMIKYKGYIGRSLGCPAIPLRSHVPIINKIKNGTCLFIFGDNAGYLSHSKLINRNSTLATYRS